MKSLVFNSKGQALNASRKIWDILELAYVKRGYSQNAGGVKRPNGGETVGWSILRERIDGKWVFPHPEKSMLKSDMVNGDTIEQACMNGMMSHNVEEHDAEWFAVEE